MEYKPDDNHNPFRASTRRPVRVSTESFVKYHWLGPDRQLPLVIEPAIETLDAVAWIQTVWQELESRLLEYGAILFRNFDLGTVARFGQFVRAVQPDLLPYMERSSPRSLVGSGIYTSTDYPANQSIRFHNEQSYTRRWPMKLWFFCESPAAEGGATPIADGRRVLALLPQQIRESFIKKKTMYVRNYGGGLGLSWQTAFQTDDRLQVERYCREVDIGFEWLEENRLRTRQVFETVVRHPKSGEALWFEHAAFFHISSLPPQIQEAILHEFDEADLPINTYYGDGSRIETAVINEIHEAYRQVAVSFAWQKGDLLLIDNMLVSHSREPFKGQRRILVAMSELHHSSPANAL